MTFCYLAAHIWTAHGGQRDALFPGKADQIRSTPYWKVTGYHASRGARKNVEKGTVLTVQNLPKSSRLHWLRRSVNFFSSKAEVRYNERSLPYPPPQLRRPTK